MQPHPESHTPDKEMVSPSTNSTAGYEYKFITEPEDALKCLICHEVARDPNNMKIVASYSVRSA